MLTEAQFRQLALAMPGSEEAEHQGHPDFRANGRVFASLHQDGRTGMVKVSPAEQRALVKRWPDAFVPATGAWGRAGCTIVTLANSDRDTVRGALRDAWQVAMASAKGRPKAKHRPRPRT